MTAWRVSTYLNQPSATSAVSANIRKNKAKIKYNTIVYLINSDEAR